jgi:ribosome recycling factor
MIEADVGVNRLGINANSDGEVVRIAYPIAIAVGRKPPRDCD